MWPKSRYRNICKCKICGDVIESTSVHDYEACSCGACATDGGLEYVSRSWDPRYGGVGDVIEEITCPVGESVIIGGIVY